MRIALPKQESVIENLTPGVIAVALFILGVLFIPTQFPVTMSNGTIQPGTVRAGQTVTVSWSQDWRDLCPVTVTREFVGSDTFKKTAATYTSAPPQTKGVKPFNGQVIVPALPPGPAYYHSWIQPHCWFDAVWQRTYRTPDILINVVKQPD